MTVASTSPEIVYVGDPMCSWCWGYAPVLDRLVSEHEIPFRIVVGGLRPGPAAQPLTEATRRFILHHWKSVAAMSGQPFDCTAFAARDEAWSYDTELPARAVVAVRRRWPDETLPFFVRLQRAFYADGVDITDPGVYPSLVTGSIVASELMEAIANEDSRTAAWRDFDEARSFGVTGFPTTLLEVAGKRRMIAAGYQPYEQVDQILHAAIDRLQPDAAIGAACAVGEPC